MKKFMVVEHYMSNCYDKIYERFNTNGRMLPEGLYYLHSWVNKEKDICFQLMETNTPELFDVWVVKWNDLVDFEIFMID